MQGRRVAITGLGVVATCGIGVDAFWTGLNSPPPDGERRIRDFDPASAFDNPKDARRTDRSVQFALAAAQEAIGAAGGVRGDPARAGVIFATGVGGLSSFEEQVQVYLEKGRPAGQPLRRPDDDAERGRGDDLHALRPAGPVRDHHHGVRGRDPRHRATPPGSSRSAGATRSSPVATRWS